MGLNSTILEFLTQFPGPMIDIALKLRMSIIAAAPTASEKLNTGWRSISYKHPEAGYFCGIFPGEEAVKLGFEHGHLLTDYYDHFDHGTNQVKYVVFADTAEVDQLPLKQMIEQAIALKS